MAAGDSLATFMQHVEITKTCWLWTGAISAYSHGVVTQAGKNPTAHRAHWILVNGLIFPGLHVCHTCENRHCVRLSHLYLGTRGDNVRDGNRRPDGEGLIRTPVARLPWPERFWAKVSICEHGFGCTDCCWPWVGKLFDTGYGGIRIQGKERLSHRIAYELTHGTFEPGMICCHRCDNPPCCNPSHLFAGSHTDNMRDAADKGRMKGNRNIASHRKPEGKWARHYDACTVCGRTDRTHEAHGLCKYCYLVHWTKEHKSTTIHPIGH